MAGLFYGYYCSNLYQLQKYLRIMENGYLMGLKVKAPNDEQTKRENNYK